MKLKEAMSDEPILPWKKGDMITFQVKPGSDEFDHGRILHISNKRGLDFYRALGNKRADGEMEEGIFDRFKRKKKYQGIQVAVKSAKTRKPVFIDASQIVGKVK